MAFRPSLHPSVSSKPRLAWASRAIFIKETAAAPGNVVAVYIAENAPSLFGDVRYQWLYRRCSTLLRLSYGKSIADHKEDGRWPIGWSVAKSLRYPTANAEAARAGRDADHRAELGQVAEQTVSA
jgi:hypothetical protein